MAGRAHPQCRRYFSWSLHARGDRRLRRRRQPRAADRARSALLLGTRRARFHETHLNSQMRAGAIALARRGGNHACHRRRARWPCAVGGHPAQTLMPRRGASKDNTGCLAAVTLDEASLGRSSDDAEHERRVAIYDLLENNKFRPVGHGGGPYTLQLGISGNRLVFDSYYAAIRTATPDRIEALDMARRALHDEGSQLVMERLKRKVDIDFDTARRLFTLISVLHWKG